MGLPLFRIQLEGVRETLTGAVVLHQESITKDLLAAVESYCSPDNLQKVLETEVNKVLGNIIADEVRSFFTYGEGRAAVRDAVRSAVITKVEGGL